MVFLFFSYFVTLSVDLPRGADANAVCRAMAWKGLGNPGLGNHSVITIKKNKKLVSRIEEDKDKECKERMKSHDASTHRTDSWGR